VDDVAPVTGSFAPQGEGGVQRHLLGPAQSAGRDVLVIEPEGLFDFLAQRS
jgi:purine-binding chemotaxis protein CheW